MARTKKPFPWLGNTHTGEIHRMASVTPECRVDLIPKEHRVEGETFKGLLSKGCKDACAHCKRKFKSRDNK
jgi:hypothetical protein